MIQILVLAVSIGLVVIGIKGFTQSGLQFSKTVTLKGRTGKIVGTICILLGLGFIPLFVLIIALMSSR